MLDQWIKEFRDPVMSLETNEMFIGFNSDTSASLVLNLTRNQPDTFDLDQMFLEAKKNLLQCATPDSVMRISFRSKLDRQERELIWNEYFINQKHLALDQLMKYHFSQNQIKTGQNQLIQITTHSKSTLLSLNMDELRIKLEIELVDICLLNTFDTQIQFIERVTNYFLKSSQSLNPTQKSLMLVQIELTQRYDNDLLSNVRHLVVDICKEHKFAQLFPNAFIAIVVIVPRENVRNVSGFQLGTRVIFAKFSKN